jgi:hypothetical protein
MEPRGPKLQLFEVAQKYSKGLKAILKISVLLVAQATLLAQQQELPVQILVH